MNEWISIIILWVVILGGTACCFAISNRRDPPPIPPEPKWPRKGQQICEWRAPCPKCGQQAALVYVHGNQLYHGEEVECAGCGNKGTVEVYGPEETDVNWEEE